jgi:hypothetical protein
MANRKLIASGNNDDPSIYDGGTLPATTDTLYLNGFVLNAVVSQTLDAIRCDALTGFAVATTAPRSIICSDGVSMICTDNIRGVTNSSEGLFRGQPNATFNVLSPLLTAGICGVNLTETINVIGGGDSTGLGANAGMIRGAGTVNWTGAIVNPVGYIADANNGGTLTINGPITQNGGLGFWARGAMNITVNGPITNSNIITYDTTNATYPAFKHNGPCHTGTVPIIRSRSPYHGTGPFFNNDDVPAVVADKFRLTSSNTFIEAFDLMGNPVRLWTASLLTGYPLASDLRLGVQAGPMGEIIGTLQPVNIDVQQLASDLLTEMNASNLAIAQGLRDGMGASAAAIAAVGSINVIP